MSDALSALFQKLIDTINALKGPIFVCLTVLGFLYTFHINLFGVYTFLNRYSDLQPILFLIWLFSGVLCLFSLASWLKQTVRNFSRKQANAKQAQEKLHHLTPEQKMVIIRLWQPDQSYHYFVRTDLMEDLEAEDIVRATGTPAPGHDGCYIPSWTPCLYILHSWVCGYLRKHPELLQLETSLEINKKA